MDGEQTSRTINVIQTTTVSRHVIIYALLDGRKIRIMIDSGATGNFIATDSVQKLRINTKQKQRPYVLRVADGSPVNQGKITE